MCLAVDDSMSICKQEILDFWNHRDQLSVEHDLIFLGQRLVILFGCAQKC